MRRKVPQPEVPVVPQEIAERFLDARLEALLVEHATKIDEGNNGLVFRIALHDVAPELRPQLGWLEGESQKGVFKLLKVYSMGKGKEEFDLQKAAYDIVDQSQGETLARIPRPFFYRDIRLSDYARDALSHKSEWAVPGRAEIILMDFVEGEDLATYLYKEALIRSNPNAYSRGTFASWSNKQLFYEVAEQVGFFFPGGKAVNPGERLFEEAKIGNQNIQKLFEFLQKRGFVFPAPVLESLRKTISLLHDQGIVHRDLHERNIMVNGNLEAGEIEHASIIDFGAAQRFQGSYAQMRSSMYMEGDRRFVQDEMVMERLSPLTLTAREQNLQQDQKVKAQFRASLGRILERSTAKLQALEKIARAGEKSTQERLRTLFRQTSTSGELEEALLFVGVLEKLRTEGVWSTGDILDFFSSDIFPPAKPRKATAPRKPSLPPLRAQTLRQYKEYFLQEESEMQ